MIQRLGYSSLSFQKSLSPRETYDYKIAQNTQVVQSQNEEIANMAELQANGQLPVENAGRKLDVVA